MRDTTIIVLAKFFFKIILFIDWIIYTNIIKKFIFHSYYHIKDTCKYIKYVDCHQRDSARCTEKANVRKEISSQIWHKWARCETNKATGHNDVIAQTSLLAHIHLVANSTIGEIKENLISHIETVLASCWVYVPKRDLREILREQRDSDAPITASFFTLGESKRSLPNGPRNFESLLEVFLLRGNTRFPVFRKNVWVARDYVRAKRSSSIWRESE